MQSWDLNKKVMVTQTRIIEWYQKNHGKVYVSFSGGKDSTVCLDIARKLYPDIPGVFIDTGLEYPEIREFVKTVPNIEWIRPEMNFREVIKTYGYPIISKEVSEKIYSARKYPDSELAKRFEDGNEHDKKYGSRFSIVRWRYLKDSNIPISSKCCDIMKKHPAHDYEKATGNKPIVATMACESVLRKTDWLQNGCNLFNKTRPISKPMSIWIEQDVLRYIKDNNLTYCPIYGEILKDKNDKLYTSGCKRTGCMFCMYGVHREKQPNRFQRMKQTHPQFWEYCMKPFEDGGLGLKNVLDFLNVKTE